MTEKSKEKTTFDDGRLQQVNLPEPTIWFSEKCHYCACLDWCHVDGLRYDPAINECQVQASLLTEVIGT